MKTKARWHMMPTFLKVMAAMFMIAVILYTAINILSQGYSGAI